MKKRALLLILGMGVFLGGIYMVQAHTDTTGPVAVCQASQCQVAVPPVAPQSIGFFSSMFDTQRWPARWNCGEWTLFHGWLYIISDILIWLSYFAIPLILASVVLKNKRALPFKRIFVLFIAFILACGLTHLIDAIIFYWPAYGLSALIRALTAGVSLMTVFALTRVAPWAMEFKSPEELERQIRLRTKELIEVNRKLNEEIKQREKAQEEINILNRSQKDFQQAIQDSSIVSMADQSGTIVYVNRNFEMISGYTKQELIGQDHRIINSGYHDKAFWINMWKTITSGKNWRGEVRNRARDGSYYWVDTFIMPFVDADGQVREFLSIRHDITARKNAEREILTMNARLEESVQARTQKLAAINKELESFTYSVSHDLRAPLRAIDGYAFILYEDYFDRLDDEGRKVIQIIMNNAKRMGQLIDDLLEFSRFGRSDMNRVVVNMNRFVEQIAHELIALEDNRRIELDIRSLSKVKVDVQMIRQVWVNLIANAIKYTRTRDTAFIEIGSKNLRNEICFYVKDNGVGFKMKYADKLFGVFQRLHKQEEFEGTGVGLALVHRIVTRHNGRVWVEAVENEGATFYFSIPD